MRFETRACGETIVHLLRLTFGSTAAVSRARFKETGVTGGGMLALRKYKYGLSAVARLV
jgi:hypothetical protein